jgi:hypothetical protein
VLQFQPTSTLHQVCNPTTPKSTLGTSTHQNKEPYTFRRSLNFETCTPWGGASKYEDELKKFFTYFKFQNLLWGSSWIWGPSPSHGTIWSLFARGIERRWRQTRTWTSTRSKIALFHPQYWKGLSAPCQVDIYAQTNLWWYHEFYYHSSS